jgi:hypothetical protein
MIFNMIRNRIEVSAKEHQENLPGIELEKSCYSKLLCNPKQECCEDNSLVDILER